ncbi:MAG: DUF6558 family protein [Paludibacteraceae bacterium]|nr:DUF6558 family protein [Paludibacteraceae bacterium]
MISPYKIKYSGIASNELNIPDLITCVAMDSDNGETPSFLNRESVVSESHDGRYKRIHRLKYTETFSPKITFMKSDFKDFSMEDVRVVMKWLTMKDTTALLEVFYDDSEVVSFASIGGFVDLQTYKLANNRTIAITATWDSISPFALSDLYTVTKTITSTDNKITINIDTDDNKPVYPHIIIKQNGVAGDIKIINQHYDFFNKPSTPVVMVVKNNTSTEEIEIDGANKIISSKNTKRIFGDDFVDWIWLPLYDGKNVLTVEGNCTVTLKYREVRKIGEY